MSDIDIAFIIRDCGGDLDKVQRRIDAAYKSALDKIEKLEHDLEYSRLRQVTEFTEEKFKAERVKSAKLVEAIREHVRFMKSIGDEHTALLEKALEDSPTERSKHEFDEKEAMRAWETEGPVMMDGDNKGEFVEGARWMFRKLTASTIKSGDET